MLDLANMLDDSDIIGKKLRITSALPAWCQYKTKTKDPLKDVWDKSYCTCCRRYCITDFFKKTYEEQCADRTVWEAGNVERYRGDHVEMQRALRNGSYKLWNGYLKTILPPEMHGWLNTCIREVVQQKYRAPDKDYIGYRYSVHHMNILVRAENNRARLEAEREDYENNAAI